MISEIPILVRIGVRQYRQFQVRSLASASISYKTEKANLIKEDDGSSEDEENINIDINDFENYGLQKFNIKQEETLSETINFNPGTGNYWLDFKLPASKFYELCGGCSLDRTKLQKEIENECKVMIKGSPSVFSVEIKAHSHEQIIRAHKLILSTFSISPKPDEYLVKSDKLLAIIPAEEKKVSLDEEIYQQEEPQIEEYPSLDIKYDPNWKGYLVKVQKFPKECADMLLSDKGKVIKRLKSEMKGNVEYQLNRHDGSLDIIGWTEDQAKEGYACLVRAVKNDRSLDAFISSRQTEPKNLERIQAKRPENLSRPLKNQGTNNTSKGQDRKFTHFLAISFENNVQLIAAQKEIHSMVLNLISYMAITPNRFHITLAMLSLDNPRLAIDALNEIKQELVTFMAGNPLELTFDKPGYFGKPNEANVLYMGLNRNKELSRLNDLNYLIHSHLMKKGILTQGDLKKQSSEIKGNALKKIYHLTFAKSKGTNNTMDVTPLLQSSKNYNIKCISAQIELLSLQTSSANSPYPVTHSLKIV